jgi:DNA-binding transcriptional LysR family regulator
MDFDQLNTFIEVARLGSFSRAAEKVLRSQPAVSAQIRQLEQEYGHKLLDRSARSVRLTPAGAILFEYANEFMALRTKSLQAISQNNGVPAGTLSIGANEGTFIYVLPKVFAKYHRAYPKVKISVYRSFTHKVVAKVEDAAIDIGIVTLPLKSSSLHQVPIFRDRVLLMVGPGNPLYRRRSVSLKEIAHQPLVLPTIGSTRRIMEKHLRPYRDNLNITMELNSVVMIKRFVAAGFGVSFISSSFARDNVRRREVKLLEIEDLSVWRELGLIYRKDRSLPSAASAFLKMASKQLAEQK